MSAGFNFYIALRGIQYEASPDGFVDLHGKMKVDKQGVYDPNDFRPHPAPTLLYSSFQGVDTSHDASGNKKPVRLHKGDRLVVRAGATFAETAVITWDVLGSATYILNWEEMVAVQDSKQKNLRLRDGKRSAIALLTIKRQVHD